MHKGFYTQSSRDALGKLTRRENLNKDGHS